jgi:hypothetical protein
MTSSRRVYVSLNELYNKLVDIHEIWYVNRDTRYH